MTFPGLCKSFCMKLMQNCSGIVQLVTNDTGLINLSRKDNPREFCDAITLSDTDYCYPNLTTNKFFYTGLGTSNFYTRPNPFTGKARRSCLQLCVQEVATNLRNPLSLKHANDGTHRVFVVEQIGVIWIYQQNWSQLSKPFLNLMDIVLVRSYTYDERGMLDIVFHPNHKENGIFYLYYTILIGGQHHIKISEMKVSNNDINAANVTSERTLLTVREPAFNHNGGQLLFGVDGYLYIFTGDGGSAGDPFGAVGNAQNKKVLLGKVLRIDVNHMGPGGKPYAIPPDNPFVGDNNYLPEIYALGVRNMWRCGMDRGNETGHNRGRIFCGDVGQGKYEEIDIIEKGANYGWRAYEGYRCFDRKLCNRRFIKNHARPIHVYSHSVGKSVTGGYVYRGCKNPNLYGKYIFGDFSFGKLFALRELPNGNWRKQNICMANNKICKNGGLKNQFKRHILSFGEDEDGELFMLSTAAPFPGQKRGSIYRIVDPARRGDPSACRQDAMSFSIANSTTSIP